MNAKEFFSFPNPVNETSARLVATGVVGLATATAVTASPVLSGVLAYGFCARVLTGPTLSPLGQLVTRVLSPRVNATPRFVAGPPKRFAQGIGVVFSVSALVLFLSGATTIGRVVLGGLIVAAALEAFAGFCLGCKIYGILSRFGIVAKDDCPECANLVLPQ